MLPGTDRVPGLGVDLGEAGQVTESVELGLVAALQDYRGKDLSQQPIGRCAGGWR